MVKILKHIALMALLAIAFSSCSGDRHWTVNGRIEGADGRTMILEASDNGRWYAIDSVTLDASGRFKITHAPSGYPDIYRLRLGDKTLYFPIDSIETVTVISRADAFDYDYTLEGSSSAQMLMQVDRRLRDIVASGGIQALQADTLLKRDLGRMILGDETGIVSYYIISKRIGGTPVFDPANAGDLRIIGAVANAFNEFRPNDPRTTYLRNLYLGNRPSTATPAPADTIHADELGHFDITLYDAEGHQRSLSDLIGQGHVVVLNFTAYAADASPAFNRALNQAWTRHHGQGLEIYQVSLDEDETAWRQAARPLPWVTVYCPPSGQRNLLNYNVSVIPTTYIIDRQGIVAERVDDITTLEAVLPKYLQ